MVLCGDFNSKAKVHVMSIQRVKPNTGIEIGSPAFYKKNAVRLYATGFYSGWSDDELGAEHPALGDNRMITEQALLVVLKRSRYGD